MRASIFECRTALLLFCIFLLSANPSFSQENFRILPYLQVYESGKVQLTWFSESPLASRIIIKNSTGSELVSKEVIGEEVPEIYYTTQEKNQNIPGLIQGSWIKGDKSYRYRIQADLPAGISVEYTVTLGGNTFNSSFKTPVSKSNWEKIRFIALSDSETEPRGRVTNRAWYPGTPLLRPSTTQLWKDKFGTTVEQGFELPNYILSEKLGYAENLKIINSRNPDFMLMPGDLVQGGGYQPGWDEFFRHNAGEFDKGLTKYPIIPALGNWEAYGGVSGEYGTNEQGKFLPIVGRSRFHAYFQTPTNDLLQKHRQSYYRVDYGPVTILTLDSSNGTPEQQASDFNGTVKLTGKQFTVPGTDTQENYTQTQYAGYGGTDLSGFGPGTDQYIWLEENLKSASASGQLIFVQYHHIAFSSGEHGVPLNHELSIGQVGTPLRILNPLLEQYGVIAVLSGHDELFERSFVDEDGNGKGIHYYDVGVAGDGMRGEKRDWQKTPLEALNYNQYRKWTADQSSVENWNTSGPVPILTDGGKHYGHLEVNLEKVKEGGQEFAKIRFTPVYSFPVLDNNYNLLKVERRVYADEVELKVLLKQLAFVPEVKDSVVLILNGEGKAILTAQNFLVSQPDVPFTYTSSKGFEFSCLNLGVNDVTITSKNTQTGQEWVEATKVWVKDNLKPLLISKNFNSNFDVTVGSLTLKPEDFIASLSDNCGIKEVTINKTTATCADLGKEIQVQIRAVDTSGNVVEGVAILTLTRIESKKITISPAGLIIRPIGQPVELTLGNEFEYTVFGWYKNGVLLPNQKEKKLIVSTPGVYYAKIFAKEGCLLESKDVKVEFTELSFSPVKEIVILELNQSGKATLKPENVFVSWPPSDPNLDIKFSQSEFTCSDIGEKQITILIKNQTGQTWEEKTVVKVQDNLKPILIPKNFKADFDVTVGTLVLKPADFISELSDNCGVKEVTINKTTATCEDLGKEIPVAIRAVDASGNVVEAVVFLTLNRIESKKVSISGDAKFCEGNKGVLTLNSDAQFEVIRWRRDGIEVEGQKGKTLEIEQGGKYHAVIRYAGGCLSETALFVVERNPLPKGEIEEKGNVLTAPAGSFTYKWFRNGEFIPGAISRELVVHQTGEFTVELTSEAGCKAKLKPVVLTISGLGIKRVIGAEELKIFPNPASRYLEVEIISDQVNSINTFKIVGMDGKDVTSSVIISKTGSNAFTFDITKLANATYLVYLEGDEQRSFFGRFIKNE